MIFIEYYRNFAMKILLMIYHRNISSFNLDSRNKYRFIFDYKDLYVDDDVLSIKVKWIAEHFK